MYKIDTHTHTISSGHAYSTIIENARVAKEKGIEVLGMTDHAPLLPGSAYIFHFSNLRVLPDYIEGVRVLKGVEANIIDFQGRIDMMDAELKHLDYAIASLHIPCINPGSKKDNTAAIIGAMCQPKVKIIGHPDDDRYPKDFSEIVKAAKYHNVLLEVNNASLNPNGFRQNGRDIVLKYLELCEKEQVKVVLASDAHFAYDVGNFNYCEEIIEASGFPEELIINHRPEEFLAYIGA